MNTTAIAHATTLARQLKFLFIATTGEDGMPHLATANQLLESEKDNMCIVTAWFCPQTIANIEKRPQISIVVWDNKEDIGFQLLGTVEQISQLGMLNGYLPEEVEPTPQVENELLIHIDKILKFSRAPHLDIECS